jgi:hypothetical protein
VLNPYPYSFAIEKKRAYMADRKIPELITPAYATKVKCPIHCTTNTIKVLVTNSLSRIESRSATEPFKYRRASLAVTLTIQNIDERALACSELATPALIA